MSKETHELGREEVLGHPALTDPQTGLANRLHFELVYRYLFAAGDRGMAFTIMLLSIGGAGEDDPDGLRAIGQTIHRTTRASDLVAHAGGDRCVVLLLGTNLPGARIAADRIEGALRASGYEPVSIGLATFNASMKDSGALLRSVEAALAVAEKAGGGVEMAPAGSEDQ
ncbi:MAG: diguanylate cyclase [Gemmatimonadota bacterium]